MILHLNAVKGFKILEYFRVQKYEKCACDHTRHWSCITVAIFFILTKYTVMSD